MRTENNRDLQNLLNIVKNESEKKGLKFNCKKTELMMLHKKAVSESNIYRVENRLKQRKPFKYL